MIGHDEDLLPHQIIAKHMEDSCVYNPPKPTTYSVGTDAKACPYCGRGGGHLYYLQTTTNSRGLQYCIVCSCCNLRGPSKGTKARALSVWNKLSALSVHEPQEDNNDA